MNNVTDAKTNGTLALVIALFELLIEKRIATIDEIGAKLVPICEQLESVPGNDGAWIVVRGILAFLRDSSPESRKEAWRKLLH